MGLRSRALLGLVLLSFQPISPAIAAEATSEALAEEQFLRGREAFKTGDYETALLLFRHSLENYATPGTLLNLAACEEKLGKLISARQHLRALLDMLPASDVRGGLARDKLAVIEPRIPRLRLDVAPGSYVGARVALDGAPLPPSSLNTELEVDPGKHVITLNASDLPERRYELVIEEGTLSSLTLDPRDHAADGSARSAVGRPREASPRRAAAKQGATPPAGSGRRAAGIVLLGVGAVGLGASVGLAAATLNLKSDLEDECPNPSSCTPLGLDTVEEARVLAWTTGGALVLGATGTALGAYLLLSSGGRERKPDIALQVGAVPLPRGGILQLAGSF